MQGDDLHAVCVMDAIIGEGQRSHQQGRGGLFFFFYRLGDSDCKAVASGFGIFKKVTSGGAKDRS